MWKWCYLSILPVRIYLGSNFVTHGQTDRQTDTYGVCGFFLSVKFATSQLALLAGDNCL